jgi:hypothetical protein
MLRLILSLHSEGVSCLPIEWQANSRWFSEALIASPFLPRYRGDSLGETHTHLDGVVGHFAFRTGTKARLMLTDTSNQLMVLEAKMFSHLSKGIKNAKYYDQAARTVACMAWTISQSNRSVDDFGSLGFYVVAPQEQIEKGIFSKQMDKSSIEEKVERRIKSYADDIDCFNELQNWYHESFIPVLELTSVDCVSWESAVDEIAEDSVRVFYERCLKFN